MAGQQEIEEENYYQDGGDTDGEGEVVKPEGSDEEDGGEDDVRGPAGSTVASQRDVEVVTQPTAERHMPTTPELGGVGGFVRRVEVDGQVEAHEHRHTNGDVSIAREVGIDLQGVDHEGGEVFERSVERRIVEHSVDKTHSEIVAQDNLLDETIANPKYSHTESPTAEVEGLIDLRDELVGAQDRSGNELGKEGGIESEVEYIADMRNLAFVNINDITNVLECKKGDADG